MARLDVDRDLLRELQEKFKRETCFDARGRDLPCWFQSIEPHECRGPIQGCHFVKRQRVETTLLTRGILPPTIARAVWDPRLGVPGCEWIHGRFDGKGVRPVVVTFEQIPDHVLAWCDDWDFRWSIMRDHPNE